MSYYLEVVKDTPYGFYMLDTNGISDVSGYARSASIVGSLAPAAPLVQGGGRSAVLSTGVYATVPFPYLAQGQERQATSIETWFFPTSVAASLATHAADTDGLYWNGNTLSFSIKLSTGYVSVSYKPAVLKKMHVVGVYTGYSLQLYVNGQMVSSRLLSEEELKVPFNVTTNNGTLRVGNSYYVQQSLALYQYALSQDVVIRHYKKGNETSGSHAVAGMYGGSHVEVSRHTANIFYQKSWSDWSTGQYTASVSESGVTSAKDPITGLYVASSWQDSFELDSGGTNINGVQIEYDGEGVFTVETSLDNGTTWSPVINTKKIAGISAGYNPSDKVVAVRVTFTAGSYGKLTFLRLTGLKDMTITSSPDLPIVIPSNALIMPDTEINLMDLNTGLELVNGSITIGPNAEEESPGIKSIGFWYYLPTGGSLGLDWPGVTFYQDGIAGTYRNILDRWVYATITTPTAKTNSFVLSGVNLKVAYISVYEAQLTAPQIVDIMQAYTGQLTRISSSTDNLATISEQDASIYAADWSISPAG